jgi:hypothetical protein
MSPRRRDSQSGLEDKGHWLRSDERPRSRAWAYEELLFGSSAEYARELAAIVSELDHERTELARLYEELDAHFERIANLETRLTDLAPVRESHEPPRSSGNPGAARVARVVNSGPRGSSAERSYSLARCEGFEVDSPSGPVGFVEGLRFVSRIDQPDLLEVRGGRFGRELLLIPIEHVEDVLIAEERVVVRSAPALSHDPLTDLVDRFRRALHFDHAHS